VVSVADPTKIDFESTAPGHVLTITAVASDGTLTSSQNFAITVPDVSLTTPVDGNAAANSVAEGAANGSTVGITASAVDPNGPATTYSLIADSSLGGFTINATHRRRHRRRSHQDRLRDVRRPAYSVTVPGDHAAARSQSFAIAVTDVAPSTPVDSNAAANSVAEGAAKAPPSASPRPRPTSTDRPSPIADRRHLGGGFTINAATGVVTVADSTKIDFETAARHAYTVTAQASDGTLASSQTFTIGVTDVRPRSRSTAMPAANSVAEGAATARPSASPRPRPTSTDRP
jgi:hypothetical protein